MDAKKIVGVTVLVGILIAFGAIIVRQMRSVPSGMSLDTPKAMMPKDAQPVPSGMAENQQTPSIDTKKPATVDAIVGDISKESDSDSAAITSEEAGETSVVNDESGSLNEVSEFYDDKNL